MGGCGIFEDGSTENQKEVDVVHLKSLNRTFRALCVCLCTSGIHTHAANQIQCLSRANITIPPLIKHERLCRQQCHQSPVRALDKSEKLFPSSIAMEGRKRERREERPARLERRAFCYMSLAEYSRPPSLLMLQHRWQIMESMSDGNSVKLDSFQKLEGEMLNTPVKKRRMKKPMEQNQIGIDSMRYAKWGGSVCTKGKELFSIRLKEEKEKKEHQNR